MALRRSLSHTRPQNVNQIDAENNEENAFVKSSENVFTEEGAGITTDDETNGGTSSTSAALQSCIVVKFAPNVKAATLTWIVEKMRGKRRDGGAELIVRKQPYVKSEGLTLHITATNIKFLELAEEMELMKCDRNGQMREFLVNQLEDFLADGMHVDGLFTTTEKQTMVRHEIENIRAQLEDEHIPGYIAYSMYEGQSVVQVCMQKELITKVFPLHDRERLHKLGRRWYMSMFGTQPLEEIRLYFGEAVALYFTFLGFYTTALIVPMLLGFIQLFVSSESLAFFCVFNVIWVTIFLEVWKRKCNELAFNWGTIGMTSLDEPRPSFYGHMEIDAVSGRLQPQFPRWKTNVKMYCVSIPIVLVCLVLAFGVMLVSFWAEDYLRQQIKPEYEWKSYIVWLPSIIYAALVYIMNVFYRKFATFLTEWENHRTQSQYDRHRVTKLVLFEFVNNFMCMFYIAFIIQDMDMLRTQLATMLIILQAINNFQEAILPLLYRFYLQKLTQLKKYLFCITPVSKKTKNQQKADNLGDAEVYEALIHIPTLDPDDPLVKQAIEEGEMENYEGTYDDYLEMFIQFGYVVLFSSVYPIAAFWAVFNNILEIRADAFKLCVVYQRPMARKVKDTGAWQKALEAVGAISIMTNCGLLCLSPQIRRRAPSLNSVEWVMLFVILEHIMLGIRNVLHHGIPDKPEWVRVALARRNFESKQALKHERTLKSRKILARKFKTVHGPHQHSL